MKLRLASIDEVIALTDISERAFNSDYLIGSGNPNEGPPDYNSFDWHQKMCDSKNLYSYLSDEGELLGGAVLFPKEEYVYIGRIFIDPIYFRNHYGLYLMVMIEQMFHNYKEFRLEAPLNNIRTNNLYQKLGYEEIGRTDETISYAKHIQSV